MYDYLKMVINSQVFADNLLNNALLDFASPVNIKTGEIKDQVQTAIYKNLTFIVNPSGRVEIKGSLHKYWNDGKFNYNDFNINAMRNTVKGLQWEFNIDPELAQIHNLEVGLNIVTPFKPNDLLKSLIVFKNSPFNQMRTKGPGMGKDIYFQQFGVKLYNKGLQFSRHENILRIEKKYLKMICLGKGDVFLSDLLELDFAAHCIRELLKCFDEIIITEKLNGTLLTKTEKRIYEYCNNPLNWERMSRKQRHRIKQKFTEMIQLNGEQKFKQTIHDLLFLKANELLQCS